MVATLRSRKDNPIGYIYIISDTLNSSHAVKYGRITDDKDFALEEMHEAELQFVHKMPVALMLDKMVLVAENENFQDPWDDED